VSAGTGLLEREQELETLEAAVAAAADGAAGLVLVQGPAGIGKSRLLAEARTLAEEHGLAVRSARGGELERDFPFGIVRQLFESPLAGESERSRLLAGAAGAAAAVFGYEGGDAGEPLGEGLFRVLHALYWLTVNLSSERALLLVVDDLHWCDSASLRFLAYLARRLDDLPVVLVASLRSSEPDTDQAILEELLSEPSAQLLMPGPLTAAAVAEIVRERLGEGVEPAFAEVCHSSTDGNPLLLEELLKALVLDRVPPDAAHVDVVVELGPRSASRVVLLRLARLSWDAGEVARALAVLGDGADFTAVAELAELEPLAVAAATRELVRAEILRPEPPLGFVHALVQGAVYHDLAPGERELFHERAATLLVRLGAPKEQVAAHLLVMPAHGEEWVVDMLRSAADAAVARGDPDAAVSLLRRALDEPPRPELRLELLLQLGRVEAMTSLPAAAGHLRSVYELAHEPSVRGMAADQLARSLVFLGSPDEGAAIAARAALELPTELADFALRLEAVELFALVFGAEPVGDQLERLRAYWELDPSGGGVGARSLAAVAAWNWAQCAGPADRVCALARSALEGGELLAADGLMPMVAGVPLALADLDEAVEVWDAQRAEAHRRGSMFRLAGVQLWSGYTHYLRGELGEAESELRASLETLTLWGMPTRAQWTAPFLAEVLVERGELGPARTLLDGSGSPPAGSDQAILLDHARMRLLLAEGRPEEALAYADVYELHAGWKQHPRYVPRRSLEARALDRLGRGDEAAALAGEELEIARAWGSPGTVGRSLRVLGTVLREDGIGYLEEACGLLEQAHARLEHAKALAALGGALRRARRPTEAREPLRRALELADACDAKPLVDAVRAEIYATGARPRTTALRGVLALTASERRVAGLAADGQTNRDIAQTLYVTPKTVELHLSNAYRKLGIGSRRELARALSETA
jgi:DNA-binding CsgD family transcriptional regulator